MESDYFSNIDVNERLYFRLKFERALSDFFCKIHKRNGPRRTLYLLKESPSLLSEFIERYGNEYENVLLTKQNGNSY